MSLNETITSVIRSMVPGIVRDLAPSLRYATVDSVDPIRIRYDTEDAPSAVTPETLVPVVEGDRVRVMKYNRRATIVGLLVKNELRSLIGNDNFSLSRGYVRRREGGIDLMIRARSEGDNGTGSIIAKLPSDVRLREVYRDSTWSTAGIRAITVGAGSDGRNIRLSTGSLNGGWIDVNKFIPDYFLES